MNAISGFLSRFPFVAILRGVKPEEVEKIGDKLLDAGFSIIEVPLNSPTPLESIGRLARLVGGRALVGAGTVLRKKDVGAVAKAGGRLIVMPHADDEVVKEAKRLGLYAIPGFATPTEAFQMLHAGADALKLFPAEASSPAVLKAMRAVLPADTPILPVGGINESNFRPWLAAGASGFGLGSSLYKPGFSADELGRRARRFVEEWQKGAEHPR